MLFLILRTFLSALRSHRALALENLALRHQLEVLKRNTKKPHIKNRDRIFWACAFQQSVPFVALAVKGIPPYSEEGYDRTQDDHFVLTGSASDVQNLRL